MIDEQLASLSDLAIVVAIAVYVLAMIGFGSDLAAGSVRRSDARLARRERTPDRELVAVGAGGRPAATVGAARTGSSVAASGRTGGMSAGSFAMLMTVGALALHAASVVMRGIATQRVPWGNMYEFAMTGSLVVIGAFAVIALRRPQWRVLGTFIVAPMLILMLTAHRFWYLPAAQLTPSLQNSYWLVIHVLVAILGSALFTIGAVVSVLQLIQGRRERTALEGRVPRGAVMDRLPASTGLEALSFRIHAVGFVLWTFTLIAGAIWARYAWGRYWGWDPKEVWTFIIWAVYAGYLHARATHGFRGNRAAWFALIGFACLIFNFTIVNTVINGLHSYSGLT